MSANYPSSLSDAKWDRLQRFLPSRSARGSSAATASAPSSTLFCTSYARGVPGAISQAIFHLGKRSTTTCGNHVAPASGRTSGASCETPNVGVWGGILIRAQRLWMPNRSRSSRSRRASAALMHTRRQLPLLVSCRLFLALLPLVLWGEEEHQRAIVRELKALLYRYWEPISWQGRARWRRGRV
jgi:hypothetical protein